MKKLLKDVSLTEDQALLIAQCLNRCASAGPYADPKQASFGFFTVKFALTCIKKYKSKMNDLGVKMAEECEKMLRQ